MKKALLVIDDEEAIRKSFALSLEDTDYTVDMAESGEKGIQMQKDKQYDLVFLDLKMPGLNGVDTLRQIRKMNDSVPVYIITAFHVEFFDELKSLEGEGVHFELLRKPIGSEQIVQAVKNIVG